MALNAFDVGFAISVFDRAYSIGRPVLSTGSARLIVHLT
jgi:hypothetical protein